MSIIAYGTPYLDLDGNVIFNEGDFPFSDEVPIVGGRRYYSSSLTQELLNTGALTLAAWPASLAKPEEAAAFWSTRQSTDRYMDFLLQSPNLKVMLVFANQDHAQSAPDKPHIHQAFQGFRLSALLRWVRLNPDRAYMQQATGFLISSFLIIQPTRNRRIGGILVIGHMTRIQPPGRLPPWLPWRKCLTGHTLPAGTKISVPSFTSIPCRLPHLNAVQVYGQALNQFPFRQGSFPFRAKG